MATGNAIQSPFAGTGGGGGGSGVVDWVNAVTSFGADPTGSADSTTAINNAITSTSATGIPVYLPAGTYKHSGTLNLTNGESLIGDGSQATTLEYTGSTIALKYDITGSFTGAQEAGRLTGFYLNGFSGGGSTVGIQFGDLQGLQMSDVVLAGFNSAGLHMLNASGDYAEQHTIQVKITNCGTSGNNATGCVVFDNSSWDYGNYDFLLIPNAGAHGVLMINDAQLQGAQLRIRGNFLGATPNTGAVIAIDPANTGTDTYVRNTLCDVACETAGSGTGHYLLYMGSASSASQFFATGVLNLSSVGPASQGISNANFLPFGFDGVIGDQQLAGIYSFGNDYIISTDGTSTSNGAFVVQPYNKLAFIKGGFTVDNLLTTAAFATAVTTASTTYTAAATDCLILANANSAAFTITLPATPATGTLYAIKKTDATNNQVTISPAAGNIDGSATFTLFHPDQGIIVQWDGSNWQVTAANGISDAAFNMLSTLSVSGGTFLGNLQTFGTATFSGSPVTTTDNTLDDGSGNMTVAGTLTVTGPITGTVAVAKALADATGTVGVSAATAPGAAGSVLISSSANTATWGQVTAAAGAPPGGAIGTQAGTGTAVAAAGTASVLIDSGPDYTVPANLIGTGTAYHGVCWTGGTATLANGGTATMLAGLAWGGTAGNLLFTSTVIGTGAAGGPSSFTATSKIDVDVVWQGNSAADVRALVYTGPALGTITPVSTVVTGLTTTSNETFTFFGSLLLKNNGTATMFPLLSQLYQVH